jgi:hypothetical protein
MLLLKSILKRRILVVAGLSAVLVSCSAGPTLKTRAQFVGDANDVGGFKLTPRPVVNGETLNSDDMVLSGLGWGLTDQYRRSIPTLNYVLPKLADYAQIIRCSYDTAIEDLWDVDLGTADRKRAWGKFFALDYWALSEKNFRCAFVTEGFGKQGQASYLDLTAPTGEWRFIARACVNKERFSGSNAAKHICSVWVGVAPRPLAGYTNTFSESKAREANLLRERRDKLDAIVRRLVYITEAAALAEEKCVREGKKAVDNKAKREAMAAILATGVEAGVKIAKDLEAAASKGNDGEGSDPVSPTGSAGPIGPSGQTGPTSTMTLTGDDPKAPSGFNIQNLSVDAKGLGDAFKLLFTNIKDFPTSCTEEQKIRGEGVVLELERQSLQEIMQASAAVLNAEDKK